MNSRLPARLLAVALLSAAAKAGLVGPGVRGLTAVIPAAAAEIIPWPSAADLAEAGIEVPEIAPPESGEIDQFMGAISSQESGGDYDAVGPTTRSGENAQGRYQILPSNWSSWAVEAGLPADAEQTPMNQEIVARHKMLAYYEQFGNWEAVAVAWFAGPDRVGDPDVWTVDDGGATVREYVDTLIANMSKIHVDASIQPQVDQMVADAAADGVTLTGVGWRSHGTQIELRDINGCPDVWESSPSTCDTPTAIPGTSMHERGLAIDFDMGAGVFDWLSAHAGDYGLHNLPTEPWHWSTTGG